MATITKRFIPQPWQRGRAAYAGVLATVAYTIAMEGDMALTGIALTISVSFRA